MKGHDPSDGMVSERRPIRKLDPRVIAKIAAGEMILRALSVAKELVENSLDAGAKAIEVEIGDTPDTLLIVADGERSLILSGNGDVIEPDDGVSAIGSGGPYAHAAAKALVSFSDLDARTIAVEAMKIASSICIYTNDRIVIEEL